MQDEIAFLLSTSFLGRDRVALSVVPAAPVPPLCRPCAAPFPHRPVLHRADERARELRELYGARVTRR
ncbi:hypothetical protein E2C01_001920 [Portunus trituberculatus]|uniref:Uncharacterized protein n=1 Tax=Portunus trituberculatus TaxID=210409 RepID=A0A5B7CI10_PORTR|nr:hypothetical protein [Portunus trituberculatus]